MKKRLTMLNAAFFLFATTQLAQAVPASAAPSVFFDFNGDSLADTTLNIAPGSLFNADIYASDFVDMLGGAHGGLIGFGVNVSFNAALATADSASLAAPWIPPAPAAVGLGNASLSGLYLAFPPLPGLETTPPLKLGSISFTNSVAGLFNLDLGDLHAYTDFAGLDGFAFDGLITFQDALVTAEAAPPVPLPGTVWLLGAGLAGIAGIRKKRREAGA